MNFVGIDTTMAFFNEFYWHRYHDGIFPMNFDYIEPVFYL